MQKMTFTFDAEKVIREKKYDLEALYKSVHAVFTKYGFTVIQDGSHFECLGKDDENDLARCFIMMDGLEKAKGFLENITDWYLCDNDDNPDCFVREDLYKQCMLEVNNGVGLCG